MTKIPPLVKETPLFLEVNEHLPLYRQGKVRDTFKLPEHPVLLLMITTDRISIFDFVLNALIPHKGEILNALSIFWFMKLVEAPYSQLTAFGSNIDHYLPEALRGNSDLHKRSIVVKKCNPVPFELIFRRHLGGSVWKQYQEDGTVAGQTLPPELWKWARMNEPLFTPSTKAESGHDVNITVEEFYSQMSYARQCVGHVQSLYNIAYKHAQDKGYVLLDTKVEAEITPHGQFTIVDELFTPDSSRYAKEEDVRLVQFEGGDPPFYDKEVVRNWGAALEHRWGAGLKCLDPEDEYHLDFAESLTVPTNIVEMTEQRYLDLFRDITEESLLDFQKNRLGITL